MDYAAVVNFEKASRRWAEEWNESSESETQVFSVRGIFNAPSLIEWSWTHDDCIRDVAAEGQEYWIPAKRFDTVAKVLDWTLHLMEKNWFGATDWESAVRRFYDLPTA